MNNYAITSGGLGDIIERGGAAMATANTSLEKTLALGTAGNEILNNPERVGNGLKTLALRLRGSTIELQEAGEEIDEYVTSTSKMQEKIKALTKVDIMRSATEYKDVYEILDEIAQVYGKLEDVDRAALTEALFGKNQANLGTAILTNFETAREVLKDLDSGAATGSATKEYDKWLESLEAKIAKLGSSFERVSIALFDDKVIGNAIDGLSSVLSILSGIAEVAGSIPSLAGLATVAFGLAMPGFSPFTFNKDTNAVEFITTSFRREREKLEQTKENDHRLMRDYLKLTGSSEEVANKQNELKAQMSDAARIKVEAGKFGQKEMRDFIDEQSQAITQTKVHIQAWKGFKSVLKSVGALGGNLLVGMAIGWAVEKGLELLDNYIHATEIAIEKSDEFFSQLNDSKKKMQTAYDVAHGDVAKRYAELAQGVNQLTGANDDLSVDEYKEFVSLGQEIAAQFPTLISGWDEQGKAVLKLKGNVEELTEALSEEYETVARGENLVNLREFKEVGFNGAYAKLYNEQNGLYVEKQHLDNLYQTLSVPGGFEQYINDAENTDDLFRRLTSLRGYGADNVDIQDLWYDAVHEQNEALKLAKKQKIYNADEQNRIGLEAMKNFWIQNVFEVMTRLDTARREIHMQYQTAWSELATGVQLAANETISKVADQEIEKDGFTGLTDEAATMFKNMVATHYLNAEDIQQVGDQTEYFKNYNEEIQAILLSTDEAGEAVRKYLNNIAALQAEYAEGALSAEEYKTTIQSIISTLLEDDLIGESFGNMLSAWIALDPSVVSNTSNGVHDISQSIDSLTEAYTKFSEARATAMTAMSSLSEKGYLTPEEVQQVADAGLGGAVKTTQYGSSYVDYQAMRNLDKANTQAEIEKRMEAIRLKTKEASEAYAALFEAQQEGNLAELKNQRAIIDARKEEIEIINRQIDALEGSLSALNAFKQASSMGELGDNFRATKEAIDAIKDGLESGRVGTNKFAAAVELMFGEDILSGFKSGKIKRSDLSKMMESVGGFYDEDGNINRDAAFKRFADKNIGTFFAGQDGERRFKLNQGTTMADIQSALGGVSLEMATYFLDAINEFAQGDHELLGPAEYLASYDPERAKALQKVKNMAVQAGTVIINADEVGSDEPTSTPPTEEPPSAPEPESDPYNAATQGLEDVAGGAATAAKALENLADKAGAVTANANEDEAGGGETNEPPKDEDAKTEEIVQALQQGENLRFAELKAALAEAKTNAKAEADKAARKAEIDNRAFAVGGDISSEEFVALQRAAWSKAYIDSIEASMGSIQDKFKEIFSPSEIAQALAELNEAELQASMEFKADTSTVEEANSELVEEVEEGATMPVDTDTTAGKQGIADLKANAESNPIIMSVDVRNPYATPRSNPTVSHAAQVDGGIAYADGSTLVGELAPEIIVDRKTGTWSLVEYPQLRKLNAGDIVFNGQQTKAILNGQKTGFSKTVGGKAKADGNVSKTYKWKDGTSTTVQMPSYIAAMIEAGVAHVGSRNKWNSQPAGGGTGGKGSGGGSSGKQEEEEKEWYDWIVRLLEKAKRATEKAIEDVAEKVGYIAKNVQTDVAIQNTQSELEKNQAAADRYMQQADLIARQSGFNSNLISDIQNGKIDITQFDKETLDVIKKYEEW